MPGKRCRLILFTESGLIIRRVIYGKNGLDAYTLELLRQIPGLELTVLDHWCRGIAGTYDFKRKTIRTSQSIGAPLFRQIEESAPTLSSPIVKPVSGKLRCLQANAANTPLRYWRKRWASKSAEPSGYYPTTRPIFHQTYTLILRCLCVGCWLIILGINAMPLQ